ncbi:MAG: hypothetical protein N2Z20_01175 [Elusimicrobiales bacterium]|nr:hypothetical protein [Elusimicrobiales bacterium]
MGDDNNLEKNNNGDIKNFEDLIKDLNSLLDKIPEMLESTKAKQQDSVENFINITSKQNDLEKVEEKTQNDCQNLDEKISPSTEENINQIDLNNVIIIPDEDIKIEDAIKEQELEENKISRKTEESHNITENESKKSDKWDIENFDNIEINNLELIDEKKERNLENIDIETSSQAIKSEIDQLNEISDLQQSTNKNKYLTLILSEEAKKLISVTKPDSIPQERTRKIGIIYASNDDTILINFLKMIDEISFLSKNKPMFIERSFIIPYDENFSVESLILNCQNEKINSIVLIGELSVDKIYEIENSISQLGCIFFNIKANNLSKSTVIDFIMELIALAV